MTIEKSALRVAREAAGLSREKLARVADCSSATIVAYERGSAASERMARKLAEALGYRAEELFPGIGR